MTGRMNSLDRDVANLKGLIMSRRLCDPVTVLASDDVDLGIPKLGQLETELSQLSSKLGFDYWR